MKNYWLEKKEEKIDYNLIVLNWISNDYPNISYIVYNGMVIQGKVVAIETIPVTITI